MRSTESADIAFGQHLCALGSIGRLTALVCRGIAAGRPWRAFVPNAGSHDQAEIGRARTWNWGELAALSGEPSPYRIAGLRQDFAEMAVQSRRADRTQKSHSRASWVANGVGEILHFFSCLSSAFLLIRHQFDPSKTSFTNSASALDL